ncbi:MAG: N-6 DNA methylase [Spirochaetota bacterium]
MKTEQITKSLEKLGAKKKNIISLHDSQDSRIIQFFDLCSQSPVNRDQKNPTPEAVVLYNNRPVFYAASQANIVTEAIKTRLLHNLACRGDVDYLGIFLETGKMEVYPVTFQEPQKIEIPTANLPFLIPSIAYGNQITLQETPAQKRIHTHLFELLNAVLENLIVNGISPEDALSITGRSLFFRFLWDRSIIKKNDLAKIVAGTTAPQECFHTAEAIAKTFAWMDATFNGNLLNLTGKGGSDYWEYFKDKKYETFFKHIEAIPEGVDAIGMEYQYSMERIHWGMLNFTHIPSDLLSQVYDKFTAKFEKTRKQDDSIFYTPRNIANYMVEEAFYSFQGKNPQEIKVLDPACGAGVFLVTAFRKIISLYYQYNRKLPDRRTIRKILKNQIVGFDIDENALKLSALNLYLTALELDPNPKPIKDLKFEKLLGLSLLNTRSSANPKEEIGSIQFEENSKFHNYFDIVIGNPPWSKRGITDVQNQQFSEEIKRIAESKGLAVKETNVNPKKYPDVPFAWKASEWCKPNGKIVLALHARLLFANKHFYVKRNLFQIITVNGILNGADIRRTEVWPEVNAPFCILFASNKLSLANTVFNFFSPSLENYLNRKGVIRIDSHTVEPIEMQVLEQNSSILKQLFRGISYDINIIKKIKTNTISIQSYWQKAKLFHGRGYEISSRKQKTDEMLKLNYGKLTTAISKDFQFYIDSMKLPKFDEFGLHRIRKVEIYKGPLVLIKQSPDIDRTRGRGFIAEESLFYHETFFGFSAFGHKKNLVLVKYILVLIHSKLFSYYTLLFSAQFGVERDTYLKEDIENFPILPIEDLDNNSIQAIQKISQWFKDTPNDIDWDSLDKFVYQLYSLNKQEIQSIEDTLKVNLPFTENQNYAAAIPDANTITIYKERLLKGLSPISSYINQKLYINDVNTNYTSPWYFLYIGKTDDIIFDRNIIKKICNMADENAVSQIIIPQKQGLIVGMLKQNRYWTITRARLLSQEIIYKYEKVFL